VCVSCDSTVVAGVCYIDCSFRRIFHGEAALVHASGDIETILYLYCRHLADGEPGETILFLYCRLNWCCCCWCSYWPHHLDLLFKCC